MSSEAETYEKPGLSLTKAVEDVSQHGFAQTEALKERQKTLLTLQASLSDVERTGEMAEHELRSNVRESLMLEAQTEHLERQTSLLRGRCGAICKENTELQSSITEEEESAGMARAGFNAYRSKMEGHRAAVLHAASRTEAHRELEEKRKLVRVLTQKKEELKVDLEDPNGNTLLSAKSENDALKRQILARREAIAKKRAQLQKEREAHTQIKKDVEIQNRRYEAIVKRLHCQLGRAQAVHRQMSVDVYRMERQLAELKGQLEAPRDPNEPSPPLYEPDEHVL
ncbi:coiled-coil domain-containing protein 122-like [Pungitius pungitius]|uniref:coiled-coil domain-containing protein 122-like n=1 Tax=Pungitius pungitius TaxID=134920 RepID=UPI002E12D1FF